MANVAALLNIPARVEDLSILEGNWLGVASARYRVPVPWFCMFRSSDLAPCTISYESITTADGNPIARTVKAVMLNPTSSVADARLKLAGSRHVFDALAASAAIAYEYWAAALSQIEQLPLPFLTMDATEVLLMADPQTSAAEFARAFGNDATAVSFIKKFSGFDDGDPGSAVAALDAGFFDPQYRTRSSRTTEARLRWSTTLARLPLEWSIA